MGKFPLMSKSHGMKLIQCNDRLSLCGVKCLLAQRNAVLVKIHPMSSRVVQQFCSWLTARPCLIDLGDHVSADVRIVQHLKRLCPGVMMAKPSLLAGDSVVGRRLSHSMYTVTSSLFVFDIPSIYRD